MPAIFSAISSDERTKSKQKEWKHPIDPSDMAPTDDPVVAARFIQADGMALGLFYVRRLPVWPPLDRVIARPEGFEDAFAL